MTEPDKQPLWIEQVCPPDELRPQYAPGLVTIRGERWAAATNGYAAMFSRDTLGLVARSPKETGLLDAVSGDRIATIRTRAHVLAAWCSARPDAPCSRCDGSGFRACWDCHGTLSVTCQCECGEAQHVKPCHCTRMPSPGREPCRDHGTDPAMAPVSICGVCVDAREIEPLTHAPDAVVSVSAISDTRIVVECDAWIYMLSRLARSIRPAATFTGSEAT